MNPTYTQTTITKPVPVPGSSDAASLTPFDYTTFNVLRRPIFQDRIIEEPMYQMYMTAADPFFRGNEIVRPQTLLDNLEFGTEVFAFVEKIQNPFNLFAKNELSYADIANKCLSQLTLDCQMACLNTLPSFEMMRFRFDTEYTWGVVACDKNKQFWDMDYFTRQYSKSIAAKNFGRAVDMWNKVISILKATPAATVDAKLATKFPTHYWQNLGSVAVNARDYISSAVAYMNNSIAGIDPKVVMAPEAARDIIRSVETPWGLNSNTQRVNTNWDYDQPGYKVDEQVRDILGIMATVLIMARSPWLTYAGTTAGTIVSQYPLWNADGTKQYVAIVDPRVGFEFAIKGYQLEIRPYDCNHIQRGIQESEYVGSGVTFPIYGMVLEFDASPINLPDNGAAAATNKVIEALMPQAAEPGA